MLIDGNVLPVVAFICSVNWALYLNRVLDSTVWRAVKNIATRRHNWFQKDGANCHVTIEDLKKTFEEFEARTPGDYLRKIAWHARKIMSLCVTEEGDDFQHLS